MYNIVEETWMMSWVSKSHSQFNGLSCN